MDIKIRKANPNDVPAMLQLVKELAEFEREPEAVINTEAMMLEDGFGKNSIYSAFVAELNTKILGIALYYTAYSTWKGKILYLDDIVVTEKQRRSGIGKKLIDAVLREANTLGVNQIRWQVLEWNTPAIAFYKTLGVELDPQWINCRMSKEQIQNYVDSAHF
ncbi:MAG TPA: GNAT family N-acetyltransferase [Chitinophagales bacterium]|nr:MAG: GNAT family N-acetyltransferase [Bacteroidetes bacterium 37-13]HRN93441.1 GNAT family N-acetyltransferase [Chitinophagales bacterium]HRP39196.1 GNAT family N-acetyltransferase [Chitinophagales bacterium]